MPHSSRNLLFVASTFLAGTTLAAHHGPKLLSTLAEEQPGSGFGSILVRAGDVNGDGFDDLLIGAPFFEADGSPYAGKVYLFLGGPNGLEETAAWTYTGDRDHPVAYYLGTPLAAVDVNGDGYSDVVIGIENYSGGVTDQGEVLVFLGSPAGPPPEPSWIGLGGSEFAGLGWSVAPAGDVDGDGFNDLAVAGYGTNQVWVYRGSAAGLSQSPAWLLNGPPAPYLLINNDYGFSIAAADVDGDGFADLAVGGIGISDPHPWGGRAYVYRGGTTGVSDGNAWIHDGIQGDENFGWALGFGDLNGDGFADLVANTPWWDSPDQGDMGRIEVYYGSRALLPDEPDQLLPGRIGYEGFGQSAIVGDVDGDGFDDIVTLAADRIYYGSPSGVGDWTAWDPHTGIEAAPYLYPISAAGDVNGDSIGDIAVHGYNYPPGPERVYLFAGQPRNRPPEANCPGPVAWECSGDSEATGSLDGSASHDPDGDPLTYAWTSSSCALDGADLAEAVATCPLGDDTATLAVTDDSSASAACTSHINVRDTRPPLGTILFPTSRSCFGPAQIPVTVTDDFADVCEASVRRGYDPGPGPSYSQHGDHHVTLTAADSSGNASTAEVDFTIDTVPPRVELLAPADRSVLAPTSLPFTIAFRDNDDDGAAGGVIHEVILLQGCTIFDGLTYGNEDGLLSDESMTIGAAELCRAAAACGFQILNRPEIRVEATDCGGNVGSASHRFAGSIALRPGICGR